MITFSSSPTFTQNGRFVFHSVISGRCTTSIVQGGVSVLSFITRIDDDIHTDVRVYFVDVSSPYSYFQQIGVLSSRVWLLCILVQGCLLLLHQRWLGYPFFFKLALTISYLNINMFPFTNFSSGLTEAKNRVSRWKGNLAALWTLPYYGSILLRLFFLCLKDLTSGANQLCTWGWSENRRHGFFLNTCELRNNKDHRVLDWFTKRFL